ncbi:acyltransferase [Desulfotignum phosphitoxidans]|nr:acyltransferase [Desulfotignum phosphitoxidans]
MTKYLGLPKSLYLNIKYFGIKDGLKLPIMLAGKVVLKNCKGTVKIGSPLKRGMILIGFTSTPLSTLKEHSVWNIEGELEFKGNATLGRGTKIAVGKNAKLTIGKHFEITANSSISCHNEIVIGEKCLFSWDILLLDTDGHPYFSQQNELMNPNGKIIVGDNCWLGCRCLVLKNTQIGSGSIVASGSLLNKKFEKTDCLIAGAPAKIKKENISRTKS